MFSTQKKIVGFVILDGIVDIFFPWILFEFGRKLWNFLYYWKFSSFEIFWERYQIILNDYFHMYKLLDFVLNLFGAIFEKLQKFFLGEEKRKKKEGPSQPARPRKQPIWQPRPVAMSG